MGIDTLGKLKDKLTCQEITEKLDQIENIKVLDSDFHKQVGKTCGFMMFEINLKNKTEKRHVFILEDCEDKLEGLEIGVHTSLSIGYSSNSSEVMTILLESLGGGILVPNDCAPNDSFEYYSNIKGV